MRRALLALALTGTLALTGCSGAGDEPADDPEAGAEAPTTEEAGAEAGAESDPLDPACLVGDWVLTQEQMQGFYDAMTSETEGATFDAAGTAGLSFTATEYRWTPEFTLTLELPMIEAEAVTTGTLGGTYTASEGTITTTLGDNNLSATLTIGGAEQDATDLLGDFITSDPINDTPYDCSDPDAPVLQFETATGRTPVTLTRAG